jgi:hypothetical protein
LKCIKQCSDHHQLFFVKFCILRFCPVGSSFYCYRMRRTQGRVMPLKRFSRRRAIEDYTVGSSP